MFVIYVSGDRLQSGKEDLAAAVDAGTKNNTQDDEDD